MTEERFESLRRVARAVTACGAPIGPGSSGVVGESTLQEIGPVALLLAGFVVSGVWVFRRYGGRSAAPVPDVDREPAGDVDAEARPAGAV